jgi:hypothetical protein
MNFTIDQEKLAAMDRTQISMLIDVGGDIIARDPKHRKVPDVKVVLGLLRDELERRKKELKAHQQLTAKVWKKVKARRDAKRAQR